MSEFEFEQLLKPISEVAPCGCSIEEDSSFLAFEVSLAGVPERQMGEIVEPARPPNWREIQQEAIRLLSQSRDLRLEIALIQALLNNQGVMGLADGLALLQRTLDEYWDDLHPQLDPDDDLDPTLRINIIRGLSDYETLLKPLANIPLLSSQALGHYSLRQIRQAQGREPQDGDEAIDPSHVRAVAMDMDVDSLQAVYQSALTSQHLLEAVDTILSQRLGLGKGPDLGPLQSQLKEMTQALHPFLVERCSLSSDDQSLPANEESLSGEVSTIARYSGSIANRGDVVTAIDAICLYYSRQEPSSPVPLLLKRARNLVEKNFLEIIQDLSADSIGQIELVTGRGPES